MPDWYVSADLRRQVAARAHGLCEYCLVHEDHSTVWYEVDHIVSVKHGGKAEAGNLAYACRECNRNKGTDVGSVVGRSRTFTRLFNPRIDWWAEHFRLELGIFIVPLTEIGVATTYVLNFNDRPRVEAREILRDVGVYPMPAALERMTPVG